MKFNFDRKLKISTHLTHIFYVVLLTACSSEESFKSTSQVVAKVNGDEITINQLNSELQKIRAKTSDPEYASQKILTGLVERQLLVQEAFKLNLDRTPEVQEAVASAKVQIYAQAYISRKLVKLASPTEQEVRQFIDQHPQYFFQRKVFHTIDIVFDHHPATLDLNWLEAHVDSLDALRNVLNEKRVSFQSLSNQFSTDNLSQILLDKIKQVKVGDLLFAHDNDKVVVKSISSIEMLSMSNSQMEQMATRVLSEQHRQSFITQEINRLKNLANIEITQTNLSSNQGDQNAKIQ